MMQSHFYLTQNKYLWGNLNAIVIHSFLSHEYPDLR